MKCPALGLINHKTGVADFLPFVVKSLVQKLHKVNPKTNLNVIRVCAYIIIWCVVINMGPIPAIKRYSSLGHPVHKPLFCQSMS